MSQQPTVISGRYELLEPIGRSSLAETFQARDTLLERPVVLKALLPELCADRPFLQRFRRQAQAAANLSHPGIAAVLDWGRDTEGLGGRPGPVYYVVTEMVEGKSLAELVRTSGKVPLDRALELGLELTSAIGFAHRAGVLHGGLKPTNVLVQTDGHLKVTDFALALALSESWSPREDQPWLAYWRAPEQVQGLPADERTDVYGLGLVLYFMVTGRVPFPGETASVVANRHLESIPPAPSKLNPGVARPFETIIGRSMAKSPEDRYATVGDQRAALVRYREQARAAAPGGLSPSAGSAPSSAPSGPPPAPRAAPPRPVPPVPPAPVPPAPVAASPAPPTTPPPALPPPAGPAPRALAPPTPPSRPTPTPAPTAPPAPPAPRRVPPAVPPGPEAANDDRTAYLEPPVPPRMDRPTGGRPAASTAAPTDATDATATTVAGTGSTATATLPDGADATRAMRRRGRTEPVYDEDDDFDEYDDDEPTRRTMPFVIVLVVLLAILGALIWGLYRQIGYGGGGGAKVAVPNVVGRNVETAQNWLSSLGLTSRVVEEPNDQIASGEVIDQSLKGGQKVTKGAEVVLRVSQGTVIPVVPNVVGQTVDAARSALAASGFPVKIVEEASDAAPPQTVIAQDPAAETQAAARTTVTLTVAVASGKVTVPEVAGKTKDAAQVAMTQAGFRFAFQQEASPDVPEGTVTRSDPEAGTSVDKGSAVVVYVSAGPSIEVPSVIGKTEDDARTALAAAGFKVDRVVGAATSSEDVGRVLSQNPQAGSKAENGATVVLRVGSETVSTTIRRRATTSTIEVQETQDSPGDTAPPGGLSDNPLATLLPAPETTAAG